MDRLKELLLSKEWEKANIETINIILNLSDASYIGQLKDKVIDNLPCEDLNKINQLWFDHSMGHFGFSVQKEIYESINGENNEQVWYKFGNAVGWQVNGKWVRRNCTFDLSAPLGHLPAIGKLIEHEIRDDWGHDKYLRWIGWTGSDASEWYSEVTGWHKRGGDYSYHSEFSSFMSKISRCC